MKELCKNPIIIMSSERSGSNLLRKILGEHSTISAPTPVHFFKFLSKIYPYMQTGSSYTKNEFLTDVIYLSKEGSGNWDYNENEINKNIDACSFPELIGRVYDAYAKQGSKEVWLSKENDIFEYAFQITKVYPDARFIYLVRDCRDVCCSEIKIPSRRRHVRFHAEKWEAEQLKSLLVYNELKHTGNCHLIKYEDILISPESTIKNICQYLDITFENEMLSYHTNPKSTEDTKVTVSWKNLNKPILNQNFNKYKKELSQKQIKIIESITAPLLNKFGYTVDNKNLVNDPSKTTLIKHTILNLFIRFSSLLKSKIDTRKKQKVRNYKTIKDLLEKRRRQVLLKDN